MTSKVTIKKGYYERDLGFLKELRKYLEETHPQFNYYYARRNPTLRIYRKKKILFWFKDGSLIMKVRHVKTGYQIIIMDKYFDYLTIQIESKLNYLINKEES